MKKNITKFAIIIAFLTFNFTSFAQQVSGVVKDKKTGETLVGATVSVEGTTNGTLSDAKGVFALKVEEGEQKISIAFMGYTTVFVDVNLKSGETKDLGDIVLVPESIGLDELEITASFAKDRSTPVAFSTVEPELIAEKLGTQEYPEILKSTPSVYTTKTGGGYGDGRINLRGFDSNNIGVLINGVPVNDMENGKVYWSNWAGLSDVTRTMQVQRGLGASKLAISSVGGTINIVTKSTDAKKGGSVYLGYGNNNYWKKSFTISTGLTENNWAVTISGAQTSGDGYVKGTNFEGLSYFINISKRLSRKQSLSFTAFGAKQWHNQRSTKHLIQAFRQSADGIKMNTDYGYRFGEVYGNGYAYNAYHKPQMSLNHSWEINQDTKLSTAVYASFGRGGGRRLDGPNAGSHTISGGIYEDLSALENLHRNNAGFVDFDQMIDENATSQTGSKTIISMSTNSHDWYGILSSLNKKINNINITVGVDGRYYKGYHNKVIDDLLGGKYFLDSSDKNRDAGTPLQVGDKFSYSSIGEVLWEGLFVQAEYVADKLSFFIAGTGSNTSYRRTDLFLYTPEEGQVSPWYHFLGYSGKGGVNYNIDKYNNVFLNGGYFIRAPFFNNSFDGYTNDPNEGVLPERVLTTEFGYGFKTSTFRADLTLYRTAWMDKFKKVTLGDGVAHMSGINAIHQGVELELKYTPIKQIDLKVMTSVGDWKWQDDVEAQVFDKNNVLQGTAYVYAGGVHVGDAAQTTAAVGLDIEVLPKLKIGADYNYYDNLYAQFKIENRTNINDKGVDAWKMPAYQLVDLNAKYKFKIGKLNSTFYAKVNNLLDTEVMTDGFDGSAHDEYTSGVYFGFGRTWSIGLKVRF